MQNDDQYPLTLTRDQVRFEILFGLMLVGRSTARDWLGKDRAKSEKARELMTSTILARFDRLQVRGPSPDPSPLFSAGNRP